MHLLKYTVIFCILSFSIQTQAETFLNKADLQKSLEVFQYHCARCHGKTAEGNGRFAVIYRRLHSSLPSNFTMGYFATRPSSYLKAIISNGGEDNLRSKYMPPFKDALSDKEINMLVKLIQKKGADRRFPNIK